MNVGIVFGCFIPLHKGHISLINRAITENDVVIIGVCGFDSDRGKDFIPFRKRIELMQEKYQDRKNVVVVSVDDEKLGLTGKFDLDSWELWCNELFNNADMDPLENSYTWYVGEQPYACSIKQLYPSHKFVIADRSVIDISGTKIREYFKRYERFIDGIFYKYLEERGG